MPYTSKEKLESLIKQALEEKDIKEGMAEAGVTPILLKTDLLVDANKIWESASSAIDEYDQLEPKLESSKAQVEKILDEIPKRIKPSWAITLSIIMAIAIATLKWKSEWEKSMLKNMPVIIQVYFNKIIVGLILLLILYYIWKYFVHRGYLRILKGKRAETEKVFDIANITSELKNLEKKIDSTVLDSYIKDSFRLAINKALAESYDIFLNVLNAPGLSEIMDASKTINTTSRNSLKFMLENMPGGSIGIAGQRGAGKSTLIYSYCGPRRVINEINNRKIIPILISAPVEYESRDFILYLFTSVCKSVLEISGVRDVDRKVHQINQVHRPHLSEFYDFLIKISPRLLSIIGLVLVSFAVLISIPFHSYEKTIIYMMEALYVKPGPIFLLGILFIGLYFLIIYVQWQFGSYESKRILKEREMDLNFAKQEEDMVHVISQALEWVNSIRFQQSFTSGWSGSMKLPVGIEGNMNNVITIAQKQLSIPEIIYAFTKFLESIPDRFQIIIGIDELDKMESDEKAQKFLNEIKSVFGIPGCFYLVSISENAMSNFERRGMPIRDVFDSSFDGIVYVDYLSFEMSQKLLARRVIGKPALFFCLSYCLSGGLARDLIRYFRSLIEISQNNPTRNNLSNLCQTILSSEVKAKARAISIVIRKAYLFEERALKKILYSLEYEPVSEVSIKNCLKLLVNILRETALGNKQDIETSSFWKMKCELTAFLYYTLTLWELFNDTLSESRFKELEAKSEFDLLSKAHQLLSVDPLITITNLNEIRNRMGLTLDAVFIQTLD